MERTPETLADGRFVVKGRLGQGSRGYALHALDTLTSEEVVCKLPFDGDGNKEALVSQYRQLSQMITPHLAQQRGIFFDLRGHERTIFMVLELVVGGPASKWTIGKSRRARVDVLGKIAEALGSLHNKGMVHGDVDADNIMVTAAGRVVLIDPDASGFGSVQARATQPQTQDVQTDLNSLAFLVENLLPEQDMEGFQSIARRLRLSDTSGGCTAADVVRELRSALSRGGLPGETVGTIVDLAAWSSDDIAARRRIYGDILRTRTLAFFALLDRLEPMVKQLGLTLDRQDPAGIKELTIVRDYESRDQPRGNLFHRNAEVQAPDGDRLHIFLNAENNFLKPWPIEDRPGAIGRGGISLFDAVNGDLPLMSEDLELRLGEDVSTFLALGAGRSVELTDVHLLRWLKLLRRASYSAIRKAKDLTGDTRVDFSGFDPSPFRPLLERAGVDLGESPASRFQAVVRAMFSLEERTGLDAFGAEAIWMATPSKRPEIVRNIGSKFIARFGRFIDSINWFEISAPSPSLRAFTVELEFKPYNHAPEMWALKIEMLD